MNCIMPTPPAIQFSNVTKSYSLAGGIREQFLDAIGLPRFFRSARQSRSNFRAIDDVSFEVPRSSRYGLIGRNGAGKTTLLKLICGNFAPTSGKVDVHGAVQALMTMGHGFHPEYTGRDNIEASLQYNGLSRDDHREAVQSIIEFCELGSFLDQPFRTYSTGMQARLMFAVATAIKPDILIIDEVLGAGDAYFIAKSKRRVDVLVGTGCTLLLVSHSTQQVLELCDQVIWLDAGRIRMIGEALRVVKAYEEWIYGSIARLDGAPNAPGEVTVGATKVNGSASTIGVAAKLEQRAQRHLTLQTPTFLPHAEPAAMPNTSSKDARIMRCEAPDGISRWEGAAGLKIVGLTLSGPKGPTDRIVCCSQLLHNISGS